MLVTAASYLRAYFPKVPPRLTCNSLVWMLFHTRSLHFCNNYYWNPTPRYLYVSSGFFQNEIPRSDSFMHPLLQCQEKLLLSHNRTNLSHIILMDIAYSVVTNAMFSFEMQRSKLFIEKLQSYCHVPPTVTHFGPLWQPFPVISSPRIFSYCRVFWFTLYRTIRNGWSSPLYLVPM